MTDRVGQFFDELGRRGHEPLLDRMDAIGRVELHDDEGIEQWLVAVRGGYITVCKGVGAGEADADWVVKGDRAVFERVIHDDTGVLAALIRGTLSVELLDPNQRLGLISRVFVRPERW